MSTALNYERLAALYQGVSPSTQEHWDRLYRELDEARRMVDLISRKIEIFERNVLEDADGDLKD